MAGGAVKSFRKVVESRGGKLSAGFAVHMPMNNITIPFYSGTVGDKEQKLFANWRKKNGFIYEYVNARNRRQI